MKKKQQQPIPEKKRRQYGYAAVVIFFVLWIGGFCLAHLLLPDKEFSQMENRMLAQSPKFSANALFKGRFTADFETYVSDQFPLRDQLVQLNTAVEYLTGRELRNGVYYAGDTLIQQFSELSEYRLTTNANAVQALQERVDIPVYTALIPGAADIWKSKLPAGAPNIDQQAAIQQAYHVIGGTCIDVYAALAAHRSEAIYYRTDHHWTSLGAYYAYAACAEAMGLDAVPLSAYTETRVSTTFYGTLFSKAPLYRIAPDEIHTYVPESGIDVTVFDGTDTVTKELYCEDQLSSKNQYTLFLGGNQPQIILTTANTAAPKLLVLRDSYMDSLVPFFTPHFSQIHLLDLRYYKRSIPEYIQENDIDTLLVCYSLKNFYEDGNLPFVLEMS